MTVEDALVATGGSLRASTPALLATTFEGVSTDSRAVHPGEAFVAIVGDRFDAHDYLVDAQRAGARLLVVSRALEAAVPETLAVLRVEDTRVALGQLARAWREAVAPRVVAITGSIGKTTTKELAALVCGQLGATHRTRGNLNNDIGLPLTVLQMPADTRLLVTELGMNAPGEIARLAAIARPDIGVVTNVAPVHLQGLGSLEAIARAKGELLEALAPDRGWAVLPSDEPRLAPHAGHLPAARRVRFGEAADDEIRIERLQHRGSAGLTVDLRLAGERVQVELQLVGRYNARNAAAAAGVGLCLGLAPAEVARALSAPLGNLGHRSTLRRIGCWTVLDDCYNASPRATRAALDTVVELAAQRPAVAVLGAMLELGPQADRYHREVGAHAATLPLATLITVGELAAEIADGARAAGMPAARILQVETAQAAADLLLDRTRPRDGFLLVKGSRGARLEQVLSRLERALGGDGAEVTPEPIAPSARITTTRTPARRSRAQK